MNLDIILRDLRLAAVLEQYAETAKTATAAGWSYEQYLTTLLTAEEERRQNNRRTRYIKEARFPLLKEVAQFDFDRIPTLDKQQMLTLTDCTFLTAAEPIIFTGDSFRFASQLAALQNSSQTVQTGHPNANPQHPQSEMSQ